MNLFHQEDGHYQGWLAALLCCCAAVNEDEIHPVEKRNISRPTTITTAQNTTWDAQPTPLQQMSRYPTAKPSVSSSMSSLFQNDSVDTFFDEHDRVRPISERPPSLRPLSFGEPSGLLKKMHLHSRQKSSANLQMRIGIGRPADFRRTELTEKQRLSLKPLQLSPVVLRSVNSEPDIWDRSMNRSQVYFESTDNTSTHDTYPSTHGTLDERYRQPTSYHSSPSPASTTTDRRHIIAEPTISRNPSFSRSNLSARSSSSSIRSFHHQALNSNTTSTVPLPPTTRPSSERIRLKRKRSYHKTASTSSDQTETDLDREILELNTIVEERRAEAARPPSQSEGDHVAAVAPLMALRARSQTLTDIGSAFSRPLTSTSTLVLAETPAASSPISPSPTKSRLSRPFLQMPDAAAFEDEVASPQQIKKKERFAGRSSTSRLTGWFSSFWGVEARTSVKPSGGGHGRSMTGESWSAGLSEGGNSEGSGGSREEGRAVEAEEEPWPLIARRASQVGVAL